MLQDIFNQRCVLDNMRVQNRTQYQGNCAFVDLTPPYPPQPIGTLSTSHTAMMRMNTSSQTVAWTAWLPFIYSHTPNIMASSVKVTACLTFIMIRTTSFNISFTGHPCSWPFSCTGRPACAASRSSRCPLPWPASAHYRAGTGYPWSTWGPQCSRGCQHPAKVLRPVNLSAHREKEWLFCFLFSRHLWWVS